MSDGSSAEPWRRNGMGYLHEMVHGDERRCRYADDLGDFLPDLIPGYTELSDPAARTDARVRHARRVRFDWQHDVTAAFGVEGCTPEQIAVLTDERTMPPAVSIWSAPVPLLLVDCWYEPTTDLARPVGRDPGEIFWLEPSDEVAYVRSLALLDIVIVIENVVGPTS
jgi:hypothetical protein